jgi:hypothetical protein
LRGIIDKENSTTPSISDVLTIVGEIKDALTRYYNAKRKEQKKTET